MDAFGAILRQSVREQLGHAQETAALRLKMEALAQAANLATLGTVRKFTPRACVQNWTS